MQDGGFLKKQKIAVFDYSGILFAAVFGYLFFGQIPDLMSIFGFMAILFAVVGLAH